MASIVLAAILLFVGRSALGRSRLDTATMAGAGAATGVVAADSSQGRGAAAAQVGDGGDGGGA